jgi:uncharacterized membrane protein
MDKELSTIALVLITGLLIFAVAQPVIPNLNQPFSEIGILGPQRLAINYPKQLVAGQNFSLYIYVGNHEQVTEYYQVLLKLGNISTITNGTTPSNVPVISTYSYVLNNNQNVTFPITMSINRTGIFQRLVFELWIYNTTSSSFFYTQDRGVLDINVTSA